MSLSDIRIGDDGEILGGVQGDWPEKPKKGRPSRWRRRLRRLLLLVLIIVPVIAITLIITLASLGRIDLTTLPLYHRWCVASLGKERLGYIGLGGQLSMSILSTEGGSTTIGVTAAPGGSSSSTTDTTNPAAPKSIIYLTDSDSTRICPLLNVDGLARRFIWSPD